jgi:tripartite-type tricarboxylate transporter receptor subunit TctC
MVVAASLLFSGAAHAAWPERSVTLIVPFAAGGITDVLARLTAERLSQKFGQPFVVQNEGGGAGIIGATTAARSKPDGYTLMFTPIFLITFAPFSQKVDFNPIKDFAPISIVASSPFAITVAGSFPADTLAEFIAQVKAKPGSYTFASAGAGSLTHIASVVFLKSAGLEMIHVPYRGMGPAFTDLLAGHVQMLSASPVELKPFVDSNKVKPLGISGKERSKYLPKVPTISETVKSPVVATYNGLLAPMGTPKEIIDAISEEIGAAEKTPEFLDKLAKVGVEPFASTPDEMAKVIAEDSERWRGLANELGLKVTQ